MPILKHLSLVVTLLFTALTHSALADPMTVTWYGAEYHGSNTASGEPFDRWGYTAAHSHWAFGTRVQVTNPQNGKSTIVRVNDRSAAGFLDVSEQAAIDLGIKAQGVATLEVRLLKSDELVPGVRAQEPSSSEAIPSSSSLDDDVLDEMVTPGETDGLK